MKKIFRIILIIFFFLLVYSGDKHTHKFEEVINETSYYEYGFIEYICECGYSYKDKCINPQNNNILQEIAKELEDENSKKRYYYLCNNIIDIFINISNNTLKYTEENKEVVRAKEKVYIVYMKFKSDL